MRVVVFFIVASSSYPFPFVSYNKNKQTNDRVQSLVMLLFKAYCQLVVLWYQMYAMHV